MALSAFMAGLGLGSWGAGYLIRKYAHRIGFPPLRLYALTELLVGFSAVAVSRELHLGGQLLDQVGTHLSWSSSGYYLASGTWVALTLVPWCAFMGATIPVAMFAIRTDDRSGASRSFSYLYIANLLGAFLGCVLPLFLIELLGFEGTLRTGLVLNTLLAASAFALTLAHPFSPARTISPPEPSARTLADAPIRAKLENLWLVFGTGLTSMGMEVVWIRLFTPYLGTIVYAFATVLGVYLCASYLGSAAYRRWSRYNGRENTLLWPLLGLAGLVPLLSTDSRSFFDPLARATLGIAPFSALVGFLTPMLVDRWSRGDPGRAGTAYAINVMGCILGPLLSGFLLLPWLGERLALAVLAIPWFIAGLLLRSSGIPGRTKTSFPWNLILTPAVALASLVLVLPTKGFEQRFLRPQLRRDHTATVIATGLGMGRQLLVNGVGITCLTPITKMMAHLPLAFLDRKPQNALVICFGMGTTYRSVLSWGVQSTAVELVPSVPALFGFFHSDGPELLRSPLSHLVIDDGRRYLERWDEQYDVITLDPPPPVEAAGSSLLYSREFYSIAKRRLKAGGILQQWLPGGDTAVRSSVAKALRDSFPYVRVFPPVESTGFHFLATLYPLPRKSVHELVLRMPPAAIKDMMEWGPAPNPDEQFGRMLDGEMPLANVIEDPAVPSLQDDRPVNEYYLLRRWLRPPTSLVARRRGM
jgi:spermidine synthase